MRPTIGEYHAHTMSVPSNQPRYSFLCLLYKVNITFFYFLHVSYRLPLAFPSLALVFFCFLSVISIRFLTFSSLLSLALLRSGTRATVPTVVTRFGMG